VTLLVAASTDEARVHDAIRAAIGDGRVLVDHVLADDREQLVLRVPAS
jgi:hypothetical protein